ncbi:MAG: CobD/CbiB family protein [Burkholderiales bacterium]|nr:CobD/CbiB family protein [Burkholderiales bacterium]
MSFLSLTLALLLEQWRPLVDRRAVFAPMAAYAGFLERQLNVGQPMPGVLAWFAAVVPTLVVTWILYGALYAVSPLLGLAFNVAVLYATIGFRQQSHRFSEIQRALREGDLEGARRALAEFRGHDCSALSASEVSRLAIEDALAVAYRHVLAPALWFVVLPGPAGAVLYRAAAFLARHWGARPDPDVTEFGAFARRAFAAIDWVPARATALTFAVVGDFEDALYCWRTQAGRWVDPLLGVVLAAGAGAMGVRLGGGFAAAGRMEERPELGAGEDADTAFLDSAIGLLWRSLVAWLALLLVLSLTAALA